MFTLMGRKIAGLLTTLLLTACASPSDADNIYINTSISGELMPGVYGQVNIGNVPDYVTIYEQPVIIAPQPAYVMVEPIYLYVPPYHAYHWRDHCHYYNACARPVYFVCARDYRPHYFEPRYYNSRVYEPPRVYRHHHHNHSQIRPTMYQREMNRDSRYHRVDDDDDDRRVHGHGHRDQDRRDSGRINIDRQNQDRNQRQHDSRRDQQRDNRRQEQRHDRQQYINTYRDNDGRVPVNNTRQYQQRQPPQRNDWNRNNDAQNNAVRIKHSAEPRGYSAPRASRERVEMPVRQQYSPPPKVERASFNNGGGRDDRRREDRRER